MRASRRLCLNEIGSARIKLVATVLVFLALGFLGFRVVPVYVTENNLQRDLQDLSRRAAFGSSRVTDSEIKDMVEKKRVEYDLPDNASIDVDREGKKVTISFSCEVPVDLLLTTWNYPLKVKASESRF